MIFAGCLMLAGAALAAPGAGSYSGATSQALSLTFGVSRGGKTVINFEPAFTARCRKTGSPSLTTPKVVTDVGPSLSIDKDGFSARNGNGKLRSGGRAVANVLDRVSGTFTSAHSAKGTYSVVLTFDSDAPGGFAGYQCSTGTLTWTASRKN